MKIKHFILGLTIILIVGMVYLWQQRQVQVNSLIPIVSEINDEVETKETEIDRKGWVEGKICYPSDFIPDGYILAKNIVTGEVERQAFIFDKAVGNQKYSILLDEGKYVFSYEVTERGEVEGFYTNCSKDLENCLTWESHQLIEVEVMANETVTEIDICDYYYQSENKPKW